MSVSTHAEFNCGVRTDRTLACWGYGIGLPPVGLFVDVSTGGSQACAVRTDGSLVCWGSIDTRMGFGVYPRQ